MISFDDAVALIASAAKPLGIETVSLDHAASRLLAEPVLAQIDSPISDVSAMDGYAVQTADLEPSASLTVIGASYPGAGFTGDVAKGQAVRIFTGAPVPAGTDRIMIQENVTRDGDTAFVAEMPGPSRHIRKRASDFACGDTLLGAGARLTPAALIAAAGADQSTLTVWRRPRISVVSTGDELVAPGTARQHPGMIPDSVSLGIAAFAREWGAEVVARRHLADDLTAMQAAAGALLASSDLIIVTGGASVGERDFSRRIFERHDLEILFSKVAIKPGKPVWLGRAGEAMILGLPGNPTSALVMARLLLAPLILGLSGGDPFLALQWQGLPLAAPLTACGDRETIVRGTINDHAVQLLRNQDSGSQLTLANAQLLVRQPAFSPARSIGDIVDVLRLDGIS